MGAVMKRYNGYSLPELSMTMVVSSLIYVGFLTMFFEQTKNELINNTEDKIKVVEEAIHSYVALHGHLPCPANRFTALEVFDFGLETSCDTELPLDIPDVGGLGGLIGGLGDILGLGEITDLLGLHDIALLNTSVRIGTIPTNALGLDKSYAYDGWRNRFTYAVVKELANSSDEFRGFSSSEPSLIIRDINGNQINQSNDTAYVILSHGQHGFGAITLSGLLPKVCAVASITENCNDDNIFLDAKFLPNDDSASYVRWATRSQLIKSTKLAISLP